MKKLTQRMIDVLNERHGDTTKVATADRMAELGMITITDRWVLTRGSPGMSAQGDKPGAMVVAFTVNEEHPLVKEHRSKSNE